MGAPRLELYWVPLGAGATVVRLSGRVYEAGAAALQRRPRSSLYHSALVATCRGTRFSIEMAPEPDGSGRATRGVVAQGPVGLRWLGRWRLFRYEVRCWAAGEIPDLAHAVGGPVTITNDAAAVERVVDLLPAVPTPVWGRDELHAGEMWNSNSVVAWALAQAALVERAGQPPGNGRAPGWDAGARVARRAPLQAPSDPPRPAG